MSTKKNTSHTFPEQQDLFGRDIGVEITEGMIDAVAYAKGDKSKGKETVVYVPTQEAFLPRNITKVTVPPVKCQGIKTKLIPFILGNLEWDGKGTWVEPFLGSGSVLFNVAPQRALVSDVNPHIINLYRKIYDHEITPHSVRAFLEGEHTKLNATPDDTSSYYYEVRDRFNQHKDPYDFLFLTRSCFNGLMRFNGKGEFNSSFCRKPERFSKSYITKIVNQVDNIQTIMTDKDWTFEVTDWRTTLSKAEEGDLVYLDPPYIGLSVNYFNTQWDGEEADELALVSKQLPCAVAFSMWKSNPKRVNNHLDKWKWAAEYTTEHFYHIGPKEEYRNSVIESLFFRGKP